MAVDRPTFHEAWYRVADLCPRLSTGVQVYRQHFRGRMWYVLENPCNNQYSRISEEAYWFIAMLDGRRSVAEVWHACNEQLGDRAPTQGEVIQLLGQLHGSNLLYADLPPDSETLFNRYRKRVTRQVQGYLSNLLFIRIPLLDPDHFLNSWVAVLGWLYSWFGLMLWLMLMVTGGYFVISNLGELVHQSSDVLAPDNLVLLYLSLIVVKVFHEFSHAFACKRFGRLNQSGGQVHSMGVMFLVFVPLPFVDASSAWAFRNKWHRVIVGTAGVMAELAIATVAAVIWANTSTGTLHIIAYNVIFVASVSTVLFNANPLLRFDAYYVLSDLLEIPNLSQRCRNYLYYLVKRYCWGLKKIQNPAHTPGERVWFVFYGTASVAYRIFICVRILLFLNDRLPKQLFILVPIFAISAIVAWVLVPLGKFIRYLATGPELARNRLRAVGSTLGGLLLTAVCLGCIRVPDHCRIEGIVEPIDLAVVHAQGDGFVSSFLPSETTVSPGKEPLVEAFNVELDSELNAALAERRGLVVRKRLAEMQEVAAAQILDEQIEALDEKIARTESQLSALKLDAPLSGTWVSPDVEHTKGTYLQRGQSIGFVANLEEVMIRATAGQSIAAMIVDLEDKQVEVKVKGRPEAALGGEIDDVFPAGQELLPSEALGYAAGGSAPTAAQDPRGRTAAEKRFEVRIIPQKDDSIRLLPGQRTIVRVNMGPKPLAVQWWRSARQLFQRRFHI